MGSRPGTRVKRPLFTGCDVWANSVAMRRLALLAAALLALCACGPKKYVLLSPEDDYSDDPALSLEIEAVQETVKGRTEITAVLANRGTEPLPVGEAEAILLDSAEKAMPLLAKPTETVEPGQEKTLLWAFDTTTASKGALEMQLRLGNRKIWPIIFSTERPPDFKPVPQDTGPQGPQGRPPF